MEVTCDLEVDVNGEEIFLVNKVNSFILSMLMDNLDFFFLSKC